MPADDSPDRELVSEYFNTDYCFEYLKQQYLIEIGKKNEGVDGLLKCVGEREWAFITAWNPRSIPQNRLVNEIEMSNLKTHLTRNEKKYYQGAGIGRRGDWEEPSLFIPGLNLDESVEIARRYNQNAFVHGCLECVARLILLEYSSLHI